MSHWIQTRIWIWEQVGYLSYESGFIGKESNIFFTSESYSSAQYFIDILTVNYIFIIIVNK